MSEINEILNMFYHINEDVEKTIQRNERNINELKVVLEKLDYIHKKIIKLENKTQTSL